LATVIEQVYDDKYAEVLEGHILNELDMSQTGQATTLTIIPNMTSGYHWVNEEELKVAPYRNYSMLKGAGDMYSTTIDLMKWANSFYVHTLLPEKIVKSLFTAPNQKYKKAGDYYGFGWYVDMSGINKYYHGGGTWGYSSYVALYPEEKLSIIILSNVSRLPVTTLGIDIEKIVFNQPFQMPVIQKEIYEDPSNLKQYIGQYKSMTKPVELHIFMVGDALFAKLGENPAFKLSSKGHHQFFGQKLSIDFSFQTDEKDVVGLKAVRMGQVFHFKKDIRSEEQ
jgi:CubicO group peptidase (beta-lactamase class C family)